MLTATVTATDIHGGRTEMTVKELIERLNAMDPDHVVYLQGHDDVSEVEFVTLESEAMTEVHYKMVTRKTLALYNGQQIVVDVPHQEPSYTYHPGVVLS
jgi:hypothetical protein